ncbi:hypothetical protein ACFE04_027258 [Oxalis oulophora]
MLTIGRNISKLKPLISLSSSSSLLLLKTQSSNSQSSFTTTIKQFPQQLFFSTTTTTTTEASLNRDGNFNESTPNNSICPGCGIHIQNTNPQQPGYFTKPIHTSPYQLNFKKDRHLLVPVSTHTIKNGSFLLNPVVGDNDNDDVVAQVGNVLERPVVCSRCHSLRNYGKVKDLNLENLMPDFDFEYTVGKKLASVSRTRSVVLMVVDAVDFDGSFPVKAAKIISDTIEDNEDAWKKGKSGNVPRVVLVVTKIDLLPVSLSPTTLEHWVRQRAREGGANKITKVHMVSAVRDWGLKNLLDDVADLAGPRGHVWAIGAQNAGKSTLLNALGKHASKGRSGKAVSCLTEAPVPGTTLGIVRLEKVLPGQAKLFDTPGLLHPHQITTRLTMEEQKLVRISKEVKPRTYRIEVGHTIHIAGLMRLDVEKSSVNSMYITVWASPFLPLHMGKTEKATRMLEDHFGRQLQPPIGSKRVKELGKWVRQEFRITGNSWDSSSVDIAASGLGWFSIGLKGEAVVGVWTYEGVDVILRNALLPIRSKIFEETGFTISEIVSKADQALNKLRRHSEKKKKNAKETVQRELSSPAVDVSITGNDTPGNGFAAGWGTLTELGRAEHER